MKLVLHFFQTVQLIHWFLQKITAPRYERIYVISLSQSRLWVIDMVKASVHFMSQNLTKY